MYLFDKFLCIMKKEMKKIWAGVVLAIMMAAVLTGVWFVEQRHESRGRAAVEEEIQAEWVAEGPENENFEVILRLFMGTKTVAGVDLKMEYSADSLELVPVSANQAVARTPLLKAMVDGKDLSTVVNKNKVEGWKGIMELALVTTEIDQNKMLRTGVKELVRVKFKRKNDGPAYITLLPQQQVVGFDGEIKDKKAQALCLVEKGASGCTDGNKSITISLKREVKKECYLCISGKREAKDGDADCDGRVAVSDFSIWRGEMAEQGDSFEKKEGYWSADFNCDGRVAVSDFSIWRGEMMKN